ncbi:MAG: SDR family NAD(P)-dependent oxidoreductase [Bryobacteraceae bacterium]
MTLNSKSILITGARGRLGSFVTEKLLVEETLARVGRIDAFVHLVGAFAGGPSLPETSDQDLARMFMMNFQSAFHKSRAVLPSMRWEGSRRILAIASRAAVAPAAAQSAYAAPKAALVSLIRSLAIENADRGICANVAMSNARLRQWTPPAEVAALSAHLTGAVIPIDASPS